MSIQTIELIFATQNENKVLEIQHLLPESIVVNSLQKINCNDDIPEKEPDLQGNALFKARYIHQKFNVDCFADDTGLEIEALNGEPGVFSARYSGLERDSEKNMDLVLNKLKEKTNRNAQFRTVMALILDGQEFLFEGIVKGKIREKRVGKKGFGYDPIFEPENCGKTFAEMTMDEKNEISHRSRAIQSLTKFLANL